jgi:hypothetical protein
LRKKGAGEEKCSKKLKNESKFAFPSGERSSKIFDGALCGNQEFVPCLL